MEKVNIYGQMEGNTLENILKTKNMEKVNIYGQMEINTLENTLKGKCMEKVNFYGPMEEVIKGNGRMGNNMGKEYSLTRRELAKKEFGNKDKELNELIK